LRGEFAARAQTRWDYDLKHRCHRRQPLPRRPFRRPALLVPRQDVHGARLEALLECLYPSIKTLPRTFELIYGELPPGAVTKWRGLPIAAFEVEHFSGTPSLALSFADEAR